MVRLIRAPNFRKTIRHLTGLQDRKFERIFERYGRRGVDALARNTPVDTGETAASWSYTVEKHGRGKYSLSWSNSVMAGSVPLVIILNYGHGVNGGGYVPGRHYINPALAPVLSELRDALASEVL